MSLITKEYVKQNFPAWDHYASQDTQAADNEAALENQIKEAETELANYLTVDEESITDPIKQHLFHITVYNLFMLQHSDTDFERTPQIVRDYDQTIEMLQMLRSGEAPPSPPKPDSSQGKVQIKSKKRRFGGKDGGWFRDNGAHQVDSTDEDTP